MGEVGLGVGLELVGDLLREHFAELDAPLVERIHVADRTLDEDAVSRAADATQLLRGFEPRRFGNKDRTTM